MKKNTKKTIIVLFVLFALVLLTGCQKNTDTNGITLPEKIIYLDTAWSTNEDFLSAILVWPLAQLINLVNTLVHSATASIAIVTILFTLVTLPLTLKSTMQSQKMQMLQPEMQKIQAKYADANDDEAKMKMSTEMQALYSKYNINPLSSILTPFLQFPILIAMYYAVQRADAVCNGTLFGSPMSTTPAAAIKNLSTQWPFIAVFVIMLLSQLLSSILPQMLANKARKSQKGYKAYADNTPKNSQTTVTMVMMVGLVGFIGFKWPIAMSVYWLLNSVINAVKTILTQRLIKHE